MRSNAARYCIETGSGLDTEGVMVRSQYGSQARALLNDLLFGK
jgi:hypothetical protein